MFNYRTNRYHCRFCDHFLRTEPEWTYVTYRAFSDRVDFVEEVRTCAHCGAKNWRER